MNFELIVDAEPELVQKYMAKIVTRLNGVLAVIVADLQADERQRDAFIRHGMDASAVIASAQQLDARREKYIATFGNDKGFRP